MTHNRADRWPIFLLTAAILVLAACQDLKPPEPTTPTEALAVVYATISATASTAVVRLDAGAITADQAQKLLLTLEYAKGIADTAKASLEAGQAGDTAMYLQMATDILTQVEKRLRE